MIGDISGAQSSAETLNRSGAAVLGLTMDVSNEASVLEAVGKADDTFGGVDILVNNAAIFSSLKPTPIDQISIDLWRKVMDVNALGPLLCARAVTDSMIERGSGSIVNIASNTAMRGVPYVAHYVASKGAVLALNKALAKELGPQGIRVNAIAPGFTLSDGVLNNPDQIELVGERAKAERILVREQRPSDIVGTALFLCGDASGFMTGQTLVIDGGAHVA